MKNYYRLDNVGRAKYTVNFHNGIKTHDDGSPFYDIKIFKNKSIMAKFIKELEHQGYQYA